MCPFCISALAVVAAKAAAASGGGAMVSKVFVDRTHKEKDSAPVAADPPRHSDSSLSQLSH